MKLISLNIELSRHHKLVLPFLKSEKADVICLQEMLEEDFETYKRELDMDGVYRPTKYTICQVHSESIGKKEGVAILSKKIEDSGNIFYVGSSSDIEKTFDEYKKNDNFVEPRALLWADVLDKEGRKIKIVTTHLPVTHHGEVTDFQIEAINNFIEKSKALSEFVFCGDTNAPRGYGAYEKLAEVFKDNIPKEYISSLDKNLHKAKGVNLMVDCLFTTPDYEASNVSLKDGVSDHMAVVAEIHKK